MLSNLKRAVQTLNSMRKKFKYIYFWCRFDKAPTQKLANFGETRTTNNLTENHNKIRQIRTEKRVHFANVFVQRSEKASTKSYAAKL